MMNFRSQQLPFEHESEENNRVCGGYFSSSSLRVQSGLEFILSHFSGPSFPRKISRSGTERHQIEVDSKERAMVHYQGALWEDCRISAFGVNQTNPDLIFIDIDAADFASMRSSKLALTATLKKINDDLAGAHPTVTESGRGYHIIQPLDCPMPLENIKELAAIEPETSKKFLQFAERCLSNGKCDKSNYPSLKSCQIRVPGTFNSKSRAAGIDGEVKILQRWDGYRPDFRLLVGSFYAYLVGTNNNGPLLSRSGVITPEVRAPGVPELWIEKLLQTPIDDYRKHARDLILIPYLVVRKGMTDKSHISDIVMEWADKCAQLRRLYPSRREFQKRTCSRIDEVAIKRIPHMKLSKLREKNEELCKILNE